MPSALVTGGAGFIGSHVTDRFVDEGYQVHVLDDLSSGRAENISPAAEFHQLDINSGTTMLDVAALLQRAAGTDLPIEFAPARTGEQQESFVAIDKARKVLGWEPQVSLAEGLALTYEWFAANRLTGAIEKS